MKTLNIKRAFQLFFIVLFLIFAVQGSYFFAFGIASLSLVLEDVGLQNGSSHTSRLLSRRTCRSEHGGNNMEKSEKRTFLKEGETLRHIAIVIVGFKVENERSVFYKKLDFPTDRELGASINKAFHDFNCDFVSLRAIEKKGD